MAPPPTRRFRGLWLGRRDYRTVHDWMERLFAARRAGTIGDTVLLLEHDPVITRGRGTRDGHLLASPEALRALGVDLVETGRGGDITLHAPGQLVCYPILDLSPDRRDVRRYVRDLMETMRRVARELGVSGGALDPHIGLWADAASVTEWPGQERAREPLKLGAIGVRLSRWITMHGFALNLTIDLGLFGLIVPCGIADRGVTSVEALTGARPEVGEAAERALHHLAEIFGATVADYRDLSGVALTTAEQAVA